MWCDSCLLIFPLRVGSMAWNIFIALYSLAGSIVLFRYGQFLYFDFPEWVISMILQRSRRDVIDD